MLVVFTFKINEFHRMPLFKIAINAINGEKKCHLPVYHCQDGDHYFYLQVLARIDLPAKVWCLVMSIRNRCN